MSSSTPGRYSAMYRRAVRAQLVSINLTVFVLTILLIIVRFWNRRSNATVYTILVFTPNIVFNFLIYKCCKLAGCGVGWGVKIIISPVFTTAAGNPPKNIPVRAFFYLQIVRIAILGDVPGMLHCHTNIYAVICSRFPKDKRTLTARRW